MIALGELHLTPEQFGNYTVTEIDALFDGYIRRYEQLEDLFIINCAMPAMKGPLKKPPGYKRLTAYRKKRRAVAGDIDGGTQKFWRKILKKGARPHETQPTRIEPQNHSSEAERTDKG